MNRVKSTIDLSGRKEKKINQFDQFQNCKWSIFHSVHSAIVLQATLLGKRNCYKNKQEFHKGSVKYSRNYKDCTVEVRLNILICMATKSNFWTKKYYFHFFQIFFNPTFLDFFYLKPTDFHLIIVVDYIQTSINRNHTDYHN